MTVAGCLRLTELPSGFLLVDTRHMTEEPGWTLNTLHIHMQRQIDDGKLAVAAALQAADLARTKAELASDKRFEAVNEFRATLADQTATFIPRGEYSEIQKAMDLKIQTVADQVRDQRAGRAALASGWGYFLGALAAVSTIIAIVLVFNG